MFSAYIFSTFTAQEQPHYRPQRSWAKVMFLQASVILLTGGCLSQCMLGYTPPPRADSMPRSRHPPKQTPPWSRAPQEQPPGADTPPHPGADTPQSRHPPPRSRHPPEQTPPTPRSRRPPGTHPPRADTPLEQTPPGSRHPSPWEAVYSIRSTSGRYASYWNSFWFYED